MFNYKSIAFILILFYSFKAHANEVDVLAVSLAQQNQNEYRVTVKLHHHDSGWQHYADAWRIVDQQGHILATRTLLHPHVNEQPFSRSLSNVKISDGIETLFIEAHDTVHGWSQQRLQIDLNKLQAGRLTVNKP